VKIIQTGVELLFLVAAVEKISRKLNNGLIVLTNTFVLINVESYGGLMKYKSIHRLEKTTGIGVVDKYVGCVTGVAILFL